ncbi:MAG: hypothetical protein GF344_07730 [Chitinivibrionales bacterium]|nr:hypothetical protein [Chitinivibrionales bacterium]
MLSATRHNSHVAIGRFSSIRVECAAAPPITRISTPKRIAVRGVQAMSTIFVGMLRKGFCVAVFLLFALFARELSGADLPTVRFGLAVNSMGESSHAAEAFTVVAQRPGATSEHLSFTVLLSYSGNAEYGVDYDPAPFSVVLTIPADSLDLSTTIPLTGIDDLDDEDAENILVELQPDDKYELSDPARVEIILVDNDDKMAPQIETQPQNALVMQGESAQFAVSAQGSEPLHYTWRKNGNEVYTAATNQYTTPLLTLADDGARYDCIVWNDAGSDSSAVAIVSVSERPTAPYIVTQPRATAVSKGDTASFVVVANGTEPLSYQWFADTGRLSGETLDTLVLSNRQIEHAGREYYCIISNDAGAVQTLGARLTVRPPTSQMLVVTGELLRGNGSAAADIDSQVVDMIVSLYPEPTGGAPVYTEQFKSENNRGVLVTNGSFGIHLGTGVTADDLGAAVRENPALYVSFTIAEPGEPGSILEPRTPLTASPYALSASSPIIRGALNPRDAGIDAAIGTYFVDTRNGDTWLKTFNTWVLEE